jgi:hypothetical protein
MGEQARAQDKHQAAQHSDIPAAKDFSGEQVKKPDAETEDEKKDKVPDEIDGSRVSFDQPFRCGQDDIRKSSIVPLVFVIDQPPLAVENVIEEGLPPPFMDRLIPVDAVILENEDADKKEGEEEQADGDPLAAHGLLPILPYVYLQSHSAL